MNYISLNIDGLIKINCVCTDDQKEHLNSYFYGIVRIHIKMQTLKLFKSDKENLWKTKI